MRKFSVLIVDDEKDLRRTCAQAVESLGWRAETASGGDEALSKLVVEPVDVVLVDQYMPGTDGMEVLRRIRAELPAVEVVMMTGRGTVRLAVEALKSGAVHFLEKPFGRERLAEILSPIARRRMLEEENRNLREMLARVYGPEGLVGGSGAMADVRRLIVKVAKGTVGVLIQGESGTGKELVARAIHALSERNAGPFVAVNCGAIAQSLIESELFGHVKGAFTGADRDSLGLFAAADGGTLLLDEVSEMPPEAQVKLLRVIETGTVRPVGSTEERAVSVRVLAATNRDLLDEIEKGGFRKDLYYRLNIVRIKLPPLRARPEDVPLLARHFLSRRSSVLRVTSAAMSALEGYGWPGNVRELENVVERACVLASGDEIGLDELPAHIRVRRGRTRSGRIVPLDELQRQAIRDALEVTAGDRSKAARLLGINRTTLYRKLKRFRGERG